MLRALGGSIADALNRFTGIMHTPYGTSLQRPHFITTRHIEPYVHTGGGRIYYYQIPHARNPLEFRVKYQGDLMGNGVTRDALDVALAAHGPIVEKHVVLQTGDWTGSFTVDENTDPHTLILRLTATADERIAATLR